MDTDGIPRPPRVSERAPEVSDFLQRPAHRLARYGTLVIFGLITLLVVGAATYRYPTTTAVDLVFRAAEPTVVSLSAIEQPVFLVDNGDRVEAFQTLVVSQAGEKALGDILYLEDQLIAVDQLTGAAGIAEISPVPNLSVASISGPLGEVMTLQGPLLRSTGDLDAIPGKEEQYRLALVRLRGAIDVWKKNNTVSSTQAGLIEIGFNRTTIIIAPTKPFVTANLPLPQSMSQAVVDGEPVQITFAGYPSAQHGAIRGYVAIQYSGGESVITIGLPVPLLTSKGTTIEPRAVMEASATLATGERSLLSRILRAD